MSLREKILTTDFDAWNDKPSPWIAGVLGGVGGLLGSTVAGELGSSNPGIVTGLVAGLVVGMTVLVGFAVLEYLD